MLTVHDEQEAMKPGDIVRTTCDLTPIDDDTIPVGTMVELIGWITTNRGIRWTGQDLSDPARIRKIYHIPEDCIEEAT